MQAAEGGGGCSEVKEEKRAQPGSGDTNGTLHSTPPPLGEPHCPCLNQPKPAKNKNSKPPSSSGRWLQTLCAERLTPHTGRVLAQTPRRIGGGPQIADLLPAKPGLHARGGVRLGHRPLPQLRALARKASTCSRMRRVPRAWCRVRASRRARTATESFQANPSSRSGGTWGPASFHPAARDCALAYTPLRPAQACAKPHSYPRRHGHLHHDAVRHAIVLQRQDGFV